jgi:hypothetical protein
VSEEEDREKRKGWIWATITLIAGLIIAFGVLGNRDDDTVPVAAGDDTTADADAGSGDADADANNPDVIPATGSDGAELGCRLVPGTATTTFTLDTATATALEGAGVGVAAITPAASAGNDIEFEVRSASRVSCDTISGFLGHRGGLRFTERASKVELRRYRLDLAGGSVVAFPKSTGTDSIEPFTVDTGAGAVSDDGTTFTLASAPVNLTAAGADALNSGLGVALFESGATLGAMTITGERQQ